MCSLFRKPCYECLHLMNMSVDLKRNLLMMLLWLLLLFSDILGSGADASLSEKTLDLMKQARLIDGHNDLPLKLRWLYQSKLSQINLRTLNTTATNIQKLQAGHVGAQFWSVYVLCHAQNKDAVRLTLEQIDLVRRMCETYEEFELVTSAQGIIDTDSTKIACLIGLEGGHSIDSSLATLRMYYALGVRYMSLTHNCNTPWAGTWSKQVHRLYPSTKGLSTFGKKENRGIVMVTFPVEFLACGTQAVNISTVADHFDHIRKIAGSESIGIGGDYEGAVRFPKGLEDVSKYPALIEELMRRDWRKEELRGVLRDNFLRVFEEVEKVQHESISMKASEVEVAPEIVNHPCRLDLNITSLKTANSYGLPFWGQSSSLMFTILLYVTLA